MRHFRLTFALTSAAVVALFASSAFAQDTAPPPAPPGPAAAAGGGAAATPLEDQGRLWIGFNVNGGVGTGASLSGPAGGGTFRIGYSMDHLMGVYGNISAIGWAASASNSSVNGASVS